MVRRFSSGLSHVEECLEGGEKKDQPRMLCGGITHDYSTEMLVHK